MLVSLQVMIEELQVWEVTVQLPPVRSMGADTQILTHGTEHEAVLDWASVWPGYRGTRARPAAGLGVTLRQSRAPIPRATAQGRYTFNKAAGVTLR